MKTRPPTLAEIDELLGFLPLLHTAGFEAIPRWGGGTEQADGSLVMPWPEYAPAVSAFFSAAGKEPWRDYDYQPQAAGQMLQDPARVAAASLDELKSMLTFCVRGERFALGHWAAMLDGGHVRRLLERLGELRGAGD